MKRTKREIITFKVDGAFLAALEGIENRSDFIRNAILAALESACPLCGASGTLTPNQKRHWESFTADHRLTKCEDCHEVHLICARSEGDRSPPPASP